MCQRTRNQSLKNRQYCPGIVVDYSLIKSLSVDIKYVPKWFEDLNYLLGGKLPTSFLQYQLTQEQHML